MTHQCPKCGRFLAGTVMVTNGLDEVLEVVGDCRVHGRVEPICWEWDDFAIEGFDGADAIAGEP